MLIASGAIFVLRQADNPSSAGDANVENESPFCLKTPYRCNYCHLSDLQDLANREGVFSAAHRGLLSIRTLTARAREASEASFAKWSRRIAHFVTGNT